MEFRSLWILLSTPVILGFLYVVLRKQKPASLRIPSLQIVDSLPVTWKVKFRHLMVILRLIIVGLFLIALAGPRQVLEQTFHKTEGIDIVLALDTSGSMAAEDFTLNNQRINRLAVVKKVVEDFIQKREHDRLGLVAFAGLAYTVCPLTTDYLWLLANLKRIELGAIDQDGTAIGSAIVSSTARLKNSHAKSKIVILLTDGMNNAGKVDPLTAAQAASAMGVKIYTIGAGTKGYAPFPAKDFFGRTVYQNVQIDIDETTLKKIADTTGGMYFRATDTNSLNDIYKTIDKLEKTEIEDIGYREYKELFLWFLLLGMVLLLFELVLNNTLFLKVP